MPKFIVETSQPGNTVVREKGESKYTEPLRYSDYIYGEHDAQYKIDEECRLKYIASLPRYPLLSEKVFIVGEEIEGDLEYQYRDPRGLHGSWSLTSKDYYDSVDGLHCRIVIIPTSEGKEDEVPQQCKCGGVWVKASERRPAASIERIQIRNIHTGDITKGRYNPTTPESGEYYVSTPDRNDYWKLEDTEWRDESTPCKCQQYKEALERIVECWKNADAGELIHTIAEKMASIATEALK